MEEMRRFALDRGPVTEHAERVEAGKHGTHSEPRRDPRLDADERLESLEIAADEREPHLGAGQHRPVNLELHLAGGFLQLPRVLPVAGVLRRLRSAAASARCGCTGREIRRDALSNDRLELGDRRPSTGYLRHLARIATPWTR